MKGRCATLIHAVHAHISKPQSIHTYNNKCCDTICLNSVAEWVQACSRPESDVMQPPPVPAVTQVSASSDNRRDTGRGGLKRAEEAQEEEEHTALTERSKVPAWGGKLLRGPEWCLCSEGNERPVSISRPQRRGVGVGVGFSGEEVRTVTHTHSCSETCNPIQKNKRGKRLSDLMQCQLKRQLREFRLTARLLCSASRRSLRSWRSQTLQACTVD